MNLVDFHMTMPAGDNSWILLKIYFEDEEATALGSLEKTLAYAFHMMLSVISK